MSNLEARPAETLCSDERSGGPRVDVLTGYEVALGRYTSVRRLLPHTGRRMVGAWCFVDLFGPDAILAGPGMAVPPHPHCGLQTVTWLADGEVLHRDSLGNLAMIRPGQLNLMTAGHGIAHAEESPDGHGPSLHGLQLWIALPAAAAAGQRHFDHYADLPSYPVGGAHVTVVVGEFDGRRSPARTYTPIVGVEVRLTPGATVELALRDDFEYALLAIAGEASVGPAGDGVPAGDPVAGLAPGELLYLGDGRERLSVSAPGGARVFLLGGEPFADELVMWWNFVARSHEEIVAAREAWQAEIGAPDGAVPTGAGDPADPHPAASAAPRFGMVRGFDGDPLPAPAMPTTRLKPRGRYGRRPGPPSS